MVITSVIDNESRCKLAAEHGLSLHIALKNGINILFDTGKSELFAHNASVLGIDIANIDIAVISHGHYDHGGGLGHFLKLNSKAPVYIHSKAFQQHYSLKEEGLKYIGLDTVLQDNPRLKFCNGTKNINPGLVIFSDVVTKHQQPLGNRLLFGPGQDENDVFADEQNLIITEGSNHILIAGCAHRGILNILESATHIIGEPPTHVFAGMHLIKSGLGPEEERLSICSLAEQLMAYKETTFYTMHCTGMEQFCILKEKMHSQIEYLSSGKSIEL